MLPGYGSCSVILLFLLFFLLCVVLLCDFLMFPGARHGESGIGLYRWGMLVKKKKTMHTKWGRTDSGGVTLGTVSAVRRGFRSFGFRS
jgi:hypothetical protein